MPRTGRRTPSTACCSMPPQRTGMICRHPDVAWTKERDDRDRLAAPAGPARSISMPPLTKPGGSPRLLHLLAFEPQRRGTGFGLPERHPRSSSRTRPTGRNRRFGRGNRRSRRHPDASTSFNLSARVEVDGRITQAGRSKQRMALDPWRQGGADLQGEWRGSASRTGDGDRVFERLVLS